MGNSIMGSIKEQRMNHYVRYNKYPELITLQPGSAVKFIQEYVDTLPGCDYLQKLLMEGEAACVEHINSGMTAYGIKIKVLTFTDEKRCKLCGVGLTTDNDTGGDCIECMQKIENEDNPPDASPDRVGVLRKVITGMNKVVMGVDFAHPDGDRTVVNGHVLFKPSDFTDEEIERENIIAYTVITLGEAVCKKCFCRESELDIYCSCAPLSSEPVLTREQRAEQLVRDLFMNCCDSHRRDQLNDDTWIESNPDLMRRIKEFIS